ncbi:MAG: 50S ribosomal protein L24 [Patescibacteria group bacterium]
MKLKKGDQVLVTKGKDRKRKGKIMRTLPTENKVVIEGLNIRKKHRRAKKEGEKGEIVSVFAPIFSSNLKLICPKCKKPSRISYKTVNDVKHRFCKKCQRTFS